MPIKNLTDGSNMGDGLPCIAKLYKGSEKPESGDRPGKDLNYFRVEFEEPYAHLLPIWQALYGDEPTEFEPVYLAAPTVDEVFASWKEDWNSARTLLHRCDGEFQTQWYNTDTHMNMRSKISCVAPACNCKNVGRIKLILPEFIDAAGALGYISVSTHSVNDILTMYRYLADIERMYGTLIQIPFVFGRAAKEVNAPKQVKNRRTGESKIEGRIKVKKSLFYLHVTPEFTQQRLLPMLSGMSLSLPAPAALPQISPEEGRRMLGGGGSRRIGAQPSASQPPPPQATPAPWAQDADKWAKFIAWAKKQYQFEEEDVLAAFEAAVAYEVSSRMHWRENENISIAAVIASFCDYDLAVIEPLTVSKKYDFAIWEEAQAIVRHLAEIEESEPTEEALEEEPTV